jgi:hypothetical protein
LIRRDPGSLWEVNPVQTRNRSIKLLFRNYFYCRTVQFIGKNLDYWLLETATSGLKGYEFEGTNNMNLKYLECAEE